MTKRTGIAADFDVVIPTVGRPSLIALLEALDRGSGPDPGRVLVVDDRPSPDGPIDLGRLSPAFRERVHVLRSGGRGPAGARNHGWRTSDAEWVAFLDDDVVPAPEWKARLTEDIRSLAPEVAGSQGRVRVPLPEGRRPTDWERNVRRLEEGKWLTADMAYRRSALHEVGGFDERFRRAYREDSDLALRCRAVGYRLVDGGRSVSHPVRPAGRWISVAMQAGNADDVLMDALHPGRRSEWRTPGRRRRHLAVAGAAVIAAAGLAVGAKRVAAAAVAVWAAGTAELAWSRIAPGPRDPREVATMILTSIAIPFAASGWWAIGVVRRGRLLAAPRSGAPSAVRTAGRRRG